MSHCKFCKRLERREDLSDPDGKAPCTPCGILIQQRVYGTRDLAEMHGIPIHSARFALDGLGAASIDRVNGCRVLLAERLEEFRAELRRRGWWNDHE